MLAVLGGLADVERDLIRTRTAEGRSRAKAQGRRMGRPLPSPAAAERGHQTPRAGRYVAGIGTQLQCRHIDYPPRDTGRMTDTPPTIAFYGLPPTRRPALVRHGACRVRRRGMDQA
jgi:hypothetical protein